MYKYLTYMGRHGVLTSLFQWYPLSRDWAMLSKDLQEKKLRTRHSISVFYHCSIMELWFLSINSAVWLVKIALWECQSRKYLYQAWQQLEIPRRREVLNAKIFEGSIMLNWKIPHREGGEGGRGKSLQLKYFPWEGINISGAIQSKN